MADGQVYNVPEKVYPWFKEKLAKLSKKAEKLVGAKMSLMVVGKHKVDDSDSPFNGQRMFEVFVACPEPKLAGWEFIARVDHSQEMGNLLRVVGGKTVPERYRNAAPECEHCNYKRKRRDTFVLRCEATDEYKQVGSGCLKDFLGHGDADKWAKLAELIALVGDYSRGGGGMREMYDNRWIDLQAFACQAAESVLKRGFVSRAAAKDNDRLTATAELAWNGMMNHDAVSNEAQKLAGDALEWAASLGDNGTHGLSDYEHNAYVIACSDLLEPRHIGIAASIVGVYYKRQVAPSKPKPAQVDFKNGTHQGNVGDKLTLDVTLHHVFHGERSARHMFYDANQNLYLWFAFNEDLASRKGETFKIQATVKGHDEWNGVKRTLINRVKVLG